MKRKIYETINSGWVYYLALCCKCKLIKRVYIFFNFYILKYRKRTTMNRIAKNFNMERDFSIFFLYADLNREKFSFVRECKLIPNPSITYTGSQLTYLASEQILHNTLKLWYISYYPSFFEVVMSNFQYEFGYVMSQTCLHDLIRKMAGVRFSSSVWNGESFDCFTRYMMQLGERIRFREKFSQPNSVSYDYNHQINIEEMVKLEDYVVANWNTFTPFQEKLILSLSHYAFRFGKIITIAQFKEILRKLD